jgi:hypothetical protein
MGTMSQQHQAWELIEEQAWEYNRLNTLVTQWTVRLIPSPRPTSEYAPPPDSFIHFLVDVNEPIVHIIANVGDGDMVGIKVHNEINQSNRPQSFSF